MGFVSEIETLARALQRDPCDRLPKADPARGVSLLAQQVVALRPMAHREYIVGKLRGLAPNWCKAGVALDFALVAERLDPAHPVRIGPHGVIHTGEVGADFAAALFKKMRQQEAHLEERKRKLPRPHQFIPHLRRW